MTSTNRFLTVSARTTTSEPRPLGSGCPSFLNRLFLLALIVLPLSGTEHHRLVKLPVVVRSQNSHRLSMGLDIIVVSAHNASIDKRWEKRNKTSCPAPGTC
jgi:hypothetical protein